MRLRSILACAFFASACAGPSSAAKPASAAAHEPSAAPATAQAGTRAIERVVIVSVDGLRPVDCARLPVLGALAREGAFAAAPDGALSVMPSVTYPSHTTMVTGVVPRRHGITTNAAPDPSSDGKNKNAWRWFREDIRVQTLYDAAFDAGLRTVLLNWPVSVGARATALLPEFWIAEVVDDLKVVRQLSSPGLFDRVARHFPGFIERYTPHKVLDEAVTDAAIALLADLTPQLMLLHISQVDGTQHEFGPDTPEAEAAMQRADAQVARLLAALRATEAWSQTVLVVVSDHGFLPITKLLAPYVHLATRALQERVWINSSGGSAYFYLQKADDAEAATRARQLFDELARDPANGIAAVLDSDAIAALGGDSDAFLAVEAAPGFSISRERSGPPVVETKRDYKGTHGYVPQRAEMRATMLFYGPKVVPSVLHGARLIDLAPTVAPWLGLRLDATDGSPLAVELRSR